MRFLRCIVPLTDFIVPVLLDRRSLKDAERAEKDAEGKIPQWGQREKRAKAKHWYDVVHEFASEQQERKKQLEARLIPILSVIPVISAILFGSANFILGSDIEGIGYLPRIVFFFACCYIALQLTIAFFYALSGLWLSVYRAVIDLVLAPGESIEDFYYRLASDLWTSARFNIERNNIKASRLKCAQTAMRNAALGLLVAILVVLASALWSGNVPVNSECSMPADKPEIHNVKTIQINIE